MSLLLTGFCIRGTALCSTLVLNGDSEHLEIVILLEFLSVIDEFGDEQATTLGSLSATTDQKLKAYSQSHPRLSTLSTTSVSSTDSSRTSSARFSLQPAPSTTQGGQGPNVKPPRPHIYDRHLNKTRTAEVFSEVVQYTQKRVSGINDLERRCVLCVCSQTELVSDTIQAKYLGVPH
jgi:hypothetical protein